MKEKVTSVFLLEIYQFSSFQMIVKINCAFNELIFVVQELIKLR